MKKISGKILEVFRLRGGWDVKRNDLEGNFQRRYL
jgi:hypothetical protein